MNSTTTDNTQEQQQDDEIPAGEYRARGIAGSEQAGITSNGNDQIGIDLNLIELNRTVTTVLIFTDKSEKYSIDRLRALGWQGGETLAGIDANEVKARIKYEVYAGDDGQPKRQMKVEVVTGGGRFVFDKPMDDQQKRGFFARLNQIAGSAPAGAGGAKGAPAGNGYPADWDGKSGTAPTGKPRVDLG